MRKKFTALLCSIIVILAAFFVAPHIHDQQNEELKLPQTESEIEETVSYPIAIQPEAEIIPDNKIRLLMFGDTALLEPLGSMVENDTTYTPFLHVKDFFEKYDYVVGTLDTTIDGEAVGSPNPGKAYTFSTTKQSPRVFKSSGVDAFSYAGNHTKDFGAVSVNHTIALLKEQGLGVFGAGANNNEAYTPHIATIKDTKVAFLGFNCIEYDYNHATDYEAGTASFSEWKVRDAINSAKSQADIVVIFAHWGYEHTQDLDPIWQIEWAKIFTNLGADIVIGGHPHVPQKFELVNGKPVYYSLGNFMYPGHGWDPNSLEGYMVEIVIEDKKIVDYIQHQIVGNNEGIPKLK